MGSHDEQQTDQIQDRPRHDDGKSAFGIEETAAKGTEMKTNSVPMMKNRPQLFSMGFSSHHGDIRIDTAIGGAEENRQNSRKARAGFTDAVTQGSLFRHFDRGGLSYRHDRRYRQGRLRAEKAADEKNKAAGLISLSKINRQPEPEPS